MIITPLEWVLRHDKALASISKASYRMVPMELNELKGTLVSSKEIEKFTLPSCQDPWRERLGRRSLDTLGPLSPTLDPLRHNPRRLILLSQPSSQYLACSAKTLATQKLKKLGRQSLKEWKLFITQRSLYKCLDAHLLGALAK
ncbi:hypothetical protein AAG906_036885 [Vitis piasezkii]